MINMLNRKIATSFLSIAMVLTIVGAGTYAFFTGTATSSANTFAAGSLDLDVDDNDQPVSQNVTGSIVGANMVPGGTPSTGFVSLHNSGTVDIAEIEMTTTVTETADPGNDSNLGDAINVTVMSGTDNTCTTNQVNHTGTLATQFGGTSPLTLSELNGQTFDAFPGITAGGADRYICMTAQMDSGAGNVYQGDALSVDFLFTGNQDASQ